MHQAKFSLTEEQLRFLDQHRLHGFRDRSAVVRTALERLQRELRQKELEDSASLYAELYEQDAEGQDWVEDASRGWPT